MQVPRTRPGDMHEQHALNAPDLMVVVAYGLILPDVRITPHNSGDFVGWRDALVRVFTDNFARWVDEEPLRDVVDTSLGYVPTDGSTR